MDLFQQILESTNGGRDLIVECHPEFFGVADDVKVRIRPEDRVASAHIHKMTSFYILKDFGDSQKGKDGITVFAETHGMERKDAIRMLAVRYGFEREPKGSFGPIIETRPLSGEMKTGDKSFEFKSDFTLGELRFLGPKVVAETVQQLRWHSVARMIICKEDKEVVISSTPSYPIFARDMHNLKTGEIIGRKIYQPRYQVKGDGKNYKFSYYPKGIQPGTYVHGLYELEKDVETGIEVKKVVICSGERDALVVKSMGCHPIWLNSETKDFPPALVPRLLSITQNLYYIPDVDKTGKKEAMKNVRLYPQLRTVWLPDSIKSKMSDQHKPCKDLRDWAEMHPGKDEFSQLLNTAKSYQFWHHTEKGKLDVDIDNMLYFLNIEGFWRIKNNVTDEFEFIHIDGHIIKRVTLEDIRLFIIKWSQNQSQQIRNLLLKNRKQALDQLNDLAVQDICLNNATSNSQTFCFKNKQIMVTDEDIFEVDEDGQCFFQEDKVIDHDFTKLPPMFEFEEIPDADGVKRYYIMPKTDTCKLFNVMIKTSMIYWQKEESGLQLTEDEEKIENQCLAAKMFGIGYLLHRHREKSRDWAPLLLDNNTRIDSNVAEGGSAKSFLFTDVLPACGYKVVKYVAKKKNPMEDDFIFDQVTVDTDLFYIDECPDGFEYDKLNAFITDTLIINKKNKSRFTIPYLEAPKISCITNFAPHDFGGSAMRRFMHELYGDYYHYASPTNGYTTSRTIKDDFGMVLFGDNYPEEDWNRDFNFLLQCEQFYLHTVSELNDKISPNLSDVIKRHNSSQFTSEFDDWANRYFSDANHLNTGIIAEFMVHDYNSSGISPQINKKELKRQLKAWVSCQEGLEFNPIDKCPEKNIRRIKCKYQGVQTEKFYIAGTYCG